MKTFFVLTFLVFVHSAHAQINDAKKLETAILTAFMKKDTQSLKRYTDENFILIHADGIIQDKKDFVNAYHVNVFKPAYNVFQPEDSFRISAQHEKVIGKNDLVILNGILLNQWQENGNIVRSKTPYIATYKKTYDKWQLISLYLNDVGEDYFELKDTTGVRAAIAKQYVRLDHSTEQKDLCTHLSLKTSDFSTLDQFGNKGSAQFMRQRSKMIFNAMQDSIQVHDELESIAFVGDTAKVFVHQSFKRNQFMAGKIRRVETSARQRESWMLTRDGWKLVFVDQVHPLTRVVDGIATDATKPFNPNDPAFKNK
jgi:Domain of unknown function (DUF4440)